MSAALSVGGRAERPVRGDFNAGCEPETASARTLCPSPIRCSRYLFVARRWRRPTPHRCRRSSKRRFASTECHGPCVPTTARRLPHVPLPGYHGWRCGGSSWASCRSGSSQDIRSRTGDTSACIESSWKPRSRRPLSSARAKQRDLRPVSARPVLEMFFSTDLEEASYRYCATRNVTIVPGSTRCPASGVWLNTVPAGSTVSAGAISDPAASAGAGALE